MFILYHVIVGEATRFYQRPNINSTLPDHTRISFIGSDFIGSLLLADNTDHCPIHWNIMKYLPQIYLTQVLIRNYSETCTADFRHDLSNVDWIFKLFDIANDS